MNAANGGTYIKTAAQQMQQPFGVVGQVRSAFRIRQGHYVNYVLNKGWLDPSVPATARTFQPCTMKDRK
jgi:hypothetical protein